MNLILSVCFFSIFLIKLSTAQNQVWTCLMCKESDFPNQCGANYRDNPVKIPTIQCNEPCVTFKNVYDGGCINLNYYNFQFNFKNLFIFSN